MDLVETFLEQYRRSFDLYERAARLGQQQCEVGLCSVRAQISSRAKSFDSLRRKLLSRAAVKRYATLEEIADDIPDLAGVRIALYLPGDVGKVERFLQAHFDVEPDGIRRFPVAAEAGAAPVGDVLPRRFSGYSAVHLRGRSRAAHLSRGDAAFAGVRLEIQVATVLMHAWAEVEHDLVYKPQARVLSEAERGILDEVNGLVLIGEMALERLQRSLGEQAAWGDPINSHYELGSFLRATVPGLAEAEDRGDILLGPSDVLFNLLCRCDLDSLARLSAALEDFRIGDASQPLRAAERVIVHLLAADPARAADYIRARDYVNRPRGMVHSADQLAEAARFLNRWFVVVRVADAAGELSGAVAAADARALIPEMAGHLQHARVVGVARRWCYDVLRCIEVPSAEELAAATQGLEDLLRAHWAAAPTAVRDFVARALTRPAPGLA